MKTLTGTALLALALVAGGCEPLQTISDAMPHRKAEVAAPGDTTAKPVAATTEQAAPDSATQDAAAPKITDVMPNDSAAKKEPAKEVMPTAVIQQINNSIPADCPLRALWALPMPDVTISRIWVLPQELKYNMLLVLSTQRDLIAVEATTGKTLWWKKLDGDILGEPCVTAYSIYILINNYVVNLERSGGLVLWRSRLDFPPAGSMCVIEDKPGNPQFAIACVGRVIYGLDTVKITWPPKHGAGSITQKDFSMEEVRLRQLWRFPTESLIQGQMQIRDTFLYATDLDGVVYAANMSLIDLGKATPAWKQYSQTANFAGVLASGTFIIIGSRDRNVYCYTRKEGNLVWRFESGYMVQETPAFLFDRFTNTTHVGVNCTEGPYAAINDVNGKLIWKYPVGGRAVGLDEETEKPMDERTSVLIQEPNDTLTCVAFKDGKPLWTIPTGIVGLFADNHLGQGLFCIHKSDGALVFIGRKRQ